MHIIIAVDASEDGENFVTRYLSQINDIINYEKKTNPETTTISLFMINDSVQSLFINRLAGTLEPLTVLDINFQGIRDLYYTFFEILYHMSTNFTQSCSVILMSDGLPDKEDELNVTQLKKYITGLKKKDWKFIFVGNTNNVSQLGDTIGCDISQSGINIVGCLH